VKNPGENNKETILKSSQLKLVKSRRVNLPWEPGRIILEDFKILRVLGYGGMGAVYLVSRLSSPGETFAVKTLISSALAGESRKRMFLREIRTWIDLPDHPNLITCCFFRTVEDRLAIFAEYADGGSLLQAIEDQSLKSIDGILDIAIQVAWGIQAAHDQGVIHQDIKPANVLLMSDGVARVTDFGLARALNEGGVAIPATDGDMPVLVSANGMTLGYCSPEQAMHDKLSFKTDIWSFGVMLMHIFAGDVTWKIGSLAAMVLQAHREMENSWGTRLHQGIVELLFRCFEENPDDRWKSMDEIAETLSNIYADLTGKEYPRTKPQIDTAGKATGKVHDRKTGVRKEWDNPEVWIHRACKADGRNPNESTIDIPERRGSRKAQALVDLELYEEAEKIYLNLIENGQTMYEEDLARLLNNMAFIHENTGDFPGARRLYDRSIAIRENLVHHKNRQDLIFELGWVYMNLGGSLYQRSDSQGANTCFDKIIDIWEPMLTGDRRGEIAVNIAQVYMNKAMSLSDWGQIDKAMNLFDKVISIYERLVYEDHQSDLINLLGRFYLNKAVSAMKMGDYRLASELCDKVIQIREQLVYQENRMEFRDGLARIYINKGLSLWYLGDYTGSKEYYAKAIQIREEMVIKEGRSDQAGDLALAYLNQASTLRELGETEAAITLYDKTIEIDERLVHREGRIEPIKQLAGAYVDKAVILMSKKQLPEALTLCDRALRVLDRLKQEKVRDDLFRYTAEVNITKSRCLFLTGDIKEALKLCDRGISMYNRLIRQDEQKDLIGNQATARILRAELLLAKDCHEKAAHELTHAIPVIRQEYERTDRKNLEFELSRAVQLLSSIENRSADSSGNN
jgi:serine/threonine protein kinase